MGPLFLSFQANKECPLRACLATINLQGLRTVDSSDEFKEEYKDKTGAVVRPAYTTYFLELTYKHNNSKRYQWDNKELRDCAYNLILKALEEYMYKAPIQPHRAETKPPYTLEDVKNAI